MVFCSMGRVWTRITLDEDLQVQLKMQLISKYGLLPESLGKWFTKRPVQTTGPVITASTGRGSPTQQHSHCVTEWTTNCFYPATFHHTFLNRFCFKQLFIGSTTWGSSQWAARKVYVCVAMSMKMKWNTENIKSLHNLRTTHKPPPPCSDEPTHISQEEDGNKKELVVIYHDGSKYKGKHGSREKRKKPATILPKIKESLGAN